MVVAPAVGGWIASKAVSMLSNWIASFISDRYELATNVKSKLQRIEENLRKIQPVIRAVEAITEDRDVVSWLNDLKDGVYDAEDILDFFNYESLCRSVESSGSKSEGRSSWLVTFMQNIEIGAKRAFSPDDSLYHLSDIVNKFDRLSNDALIGTFLKVAEMNTGSKKEDESFDWRQTSPVLAEVKVFSREKEMDELQDKILVSSVKNGSNGDKFSVVSIVGIGGMGKTTLAQWLFNRDYVKNHFDLQAWVCTSGKSDMRTLMISIIEYATKSPYDRKNFACIHECLLELLSEKRFLIVLDDVCDEIINQWGKLISVFRNGKEGSKIIITTRDRNVAGKVNSIDTIYLASFEGEKYWELFRCYAFGNVNPKDHPKLEDIGKQIASKLGGLPLAAKAVGGVLREKLEERHWRYVLENKEWQKGGEILPSLRLSYNLLPPYLKQCFVYCALFPKDYYFEKDKLVHLWVAQGFVESSDGTETREDIGQKYFDELYSKSFFQYAQWKEYVVIHDLLHDLAELIFADQIYRVENTRSVKLKISKRVRHLFISSNDLDKVLAQIDEPKKLRSLVYFPPYTSNISQTSCLDFKKLRGLRVLMLREPYSSSYLPETIGNMIHLRYLECPLDTKLPISLGRLYNLQVLKLSNSRSIRDEYLPLDKQHDWFSFLTKDIDDSESMFHFFNDQTTISEILGKLTNLYYINAPRAFISAIPSIGRFTSLQTLMHYEVREHECYRICELRNLNKIQGFLRIVNLENVADKEEAKRAKLYNKVHLEVLSLWWNKLDNCSNNEVREQEEVLEGLQPHSNIKVIGILRYMGLNHPSWLNKSHLSNIECISLFACGCLKALPPLGEFPLLKYLFLHGLTSLEKIGGGGVFQSLQHLESKDLEELKEWPSNEEDVGFMMPHLSKLKITKCNKLEALPPLGGLLHLTELDIINCPNLKVICISFLGELPSLKYLHLEGLDLLEEINIEIYGRGRTAFPSLLTLRLIHLKELREWSSFEGDACQPLLTELKIIGCNKLEALPPHGWSHEWLQDDWEHDYNLFPMPFLIIKDCSNLKLIPIEEYPFLMYLQLEGLDSLEEIGIAIKEEGPDLMPHLEALIIIDCHKLRSPIHLPSSLECLRFGFSKTVDGMQMFHELFPVGTLTHLKELSLGPLTGLDSFTDAQQEWFQSLTSLQELNFGDCSGLRSLPDVLESLCHLERLQLGRCREMVSLGKNNMPKNLENLCINACGELEKRCDSRQDGREWSKISHIPRIEIGTRDFELPDFDPSNPPTCNIL